MRTSSYIQDFTDLDFKKLKSEGWKSLRTLPSTNSFQRVLLIVEKHGEDAEVIFGHWMPHNNYTEGDFYSSDSKPLDRKLYMWRSLDFLGVE